MFPAPVLTISKQTVAVKDCRNLIAAKYCSIQHTSEYHHKPLTQSQCKSISDPCHLAKTRTCAKWDRLSKQNYCLGQASNSASKKETQQHANKHEHLFEHIVAINDNKCKRETLAPHEATPEVDGPPTTRLHGCHF